MGIQNSKNQYSFNDHYYIIQDSFPSDNYYRLQSKLTDQLFIGRQINCIDKQDSYQTQCIINQKLKNPSPFVTKLLSAQKNSINSYCQTNQKYYLLYRQVSKLLSNQIQERKIRNIGFTGEQIIMVIIRICKGLKYIYQIGHFHNNITANTISWPTQNHQSLQLIDQWSLRDSNRTLQSNIQSTQNNNNNVNNNNNMNNKYTDNLYQLGLVAKSMLQISQNTNKNQQLWQSINHKIFVLCSQNPIDRLQIYQIFNNRDRELENKVIHITNTNINMNNNINTNNNAVNNGNNVNVNMNMNKGYIDNRNNINVNYQNNGIQYNNQINNKVLVNKSTAPLPNQITSTNQYQYQQYSSNINQNSQYNNKFITNLNNVNYTQPAPVNTSLSSLPTNMNINNNINKQQPLNINFNNNKVATTSTLTNNYSTITNPINVSKSTNSNIYNIPPPPSSTTNLSSINGIKTTTTNNTNYQIYKQQFHKISTSSNKPSQHFYQPTPIITPDVQQNFLNIAGPHTNTSNHGLSSLSSNSSNPVITPFTIPSINTSSISAYPTTTAAITNPPLTSNTNTYQYTNQNTSNTLNSFVNSSNNFSPTFGNPSSTIQNSSSLFSFKDSLNGSSKIGGSDDNLFTSPDFFSKIHGSQMKFNNIKIQDHQTNSLNVNTLYNNNNSSLLSNNKVLTNLNPQQQYSSNLNINNNINNQQYHPQVTSSLTNNFTAVQVNHVNQKQSPNQPAVTTSLQIQQPKSINLITNNINNSSHSNQNPEISINVSNLQPITNTNPSSTISNTFSSAYTSTTTNLRPPHVSVIPQLTQQSDNQDQQHQYVVQQYQNGSRYQGQKFDGMRDGNGKFYYKQGSYYDGKWKKNNMHGFGKLYYPNHKLAYQGDWFIDQFHGYGKVYNDQPTPINSCFDYTNFQKIQQKWKYYQGTLVCDSKQGFGKLVLSNGQYYEGNFQGDRVHGQGKFVNMFGEIVHGIWEDSKLVKVLDI